MQDFIFENPTKIIFGRGQIKMIGPEVLRFGRKALLVYGRESIKKYGIYDQVTASLQGAGVSFVEFAGVKSNPVLSHVVKGIELARRENVKVILAVGGGSVIDSAKAIAAGVKAEHDVWDFFTREKTINDALPILTVVTVSASASEMNSAAVITNENGARKFSIRSLLIQPKTSIMDPSVLFTLSPAYSAYSAVDVITHIVEGYFNNILALCR
jgi:alcohol dehydrogenase YqhD (iron-dependent ADH family)